MYIKSVLIAVDQFVNTLFGGFADETFSSRAYRWKRDGIRKWPCKVIDKIALLFGFVLCLRTGRTAEAARITGTIKK